MDRTAEKNIAQLCKELVTHENKVFATSLDVAKHFDKMHKNTLRDIMLMTESLGIPRLKSEPRNGSTSASGIHFIEAVYRGNDGKDHMMFEMSKDAFSLLVMGFNGTKALQWKISYINAFNKMERQLVRLAYAAERRAKAEWQTCNAERVDAHSSLSHAVAAFIPYAVKQGSKHSEKYFVNFSNMVKRHALATGAEDLPMFMKHESLSDVTRATGVCIAAIHEGMEQGMAYKDVYKHADDRVSSVMSL